MRDVAAVANFPRVEDDDTMKPPTAHVSDVTKLNVPMPFMLTVMVMVLAIAAGVWRIEGRVSVIDARLEEREKYERELKEERKQYMEQLARTLEAQITNAGLRTAALALTQELDNLRAKK